VFDYALGRNTLRPEERNGLFTMNGGRNVIVRDMEKDDIPQLAQLYNQFWDEETSCMEAMYSKFETLREKETHILLSAVENNQLVGTVMGVICEELYGECKAFLVLENLIVDRRYRSKGVGKALVSELERRAAGKCAQIILVTEADRVDACRFYEAVGYNPNTHRGFKKKLV
jgi:GNAT superfamily N-acetyltransferase